MARADGGAGGRGGRAEPRFPLVFLPLNVGGGFTVAGSTLVAQYTGTGGEEAATADPDG